MSDYRSLGKPPKDPYDEEAALEMICAPDVMLELEADEADDLVSGIEDKLVAVEELEIFPVGGAVALVWPECVLAAPEGEGGLDADAAVDGSALVELSREDQQYMSV